MKKLLEKIWYAIALFIMLILSVFLMVCCIIGLCVIIATFPLWIIPHVIFTYPLNEYIDDQGEE
jgi:hypothetical protein